MKVKGEKNRLKKQPSAAEVPTKIMPFKIKGQSKNISKEGGNFKS